MRTPRAVILVLLLALVPAGQGVAEAPIDIAQSELLEAEELVASGFFCGPANATIIDDASASGGKAVRVDEWCDLRHEAVRTSSWGVPLSVRMRAEQEGMHGSATLFVDGSYVGSASGFLGTTYAEESFYEPRPVAPADPISVELSVFPFFNNAIVIDAILFNFHGADGCTNAPPELFVSGNGMRGGFTGWVGHEYVLTATNVDADGDALLLSTTRPNVTVVGSEIRGILAPELGLNDIGVVASESTARCPDGPTYGDLAADLHFRGVPDLAVEALQPFEGTACIDGSGIFTGAATIVVGSCPVSASIVGDAALVNATEFLLDGVPFASALGMEPAAELVVRELGEATLTACVRATADIHARVFCADELRFFGIPRP